jgi:hypothetical protein
MSDNNLYLDIKTAIDLNLGLLTNYGFDRFKEEQVAYEYHFITSNQHIKLDIWFELIISTPIWIKIDNFAIGSIEPENPIFQELARQYASVEDRLFLATRNNLSIRCDFSSIRSIDISNDYSELTIRSNRF